MKYIIMCGGKYERWSSPRQLTIVRGETIVGRTIRLLREAGVDDIAISSNLPDFDDFDVPILKHENNYCARRLNDVDGYWCEAFYLMNEPVCYIFGDVIFSPEAIKTIVETETDDIEFFASAPPFDKRYSKKYSEPFALKVVNNKHLADAIEKVKEYDKRGLFFRKPIMWELWQVIKETPLNCIYTNYVVINDYTCDIDNPSDVEKFRFIED